MMSNPFEKILGNTCEMRIIEFLLPLEDLEFNVTELAEESGVSRVSAGRVIKKFLEWELLIKKEAPIPTYRLNHDSLIIKCIKLFNTAIIETMLGEKEARAINLLVSKKRKQLSVNIFGEELTSGPIYGFDYSPIYGREIGPDSIKQNTNSPAFSIAAGGSYFYTYCLNPNTDAT